MTTTSEIDQKLLETLETLRKIGVIVANFQPESTPVLHGKINEYITNLADLDTLKDDLDVTVPKRLIETIDDGKNPEIYTRDILQELVRRNQQTHGRVLAMQRLNKDFGSELQRNYPDLWKEFEESMGNQPLDSSQAAAAQSTMTSSNSAN